ncbi:uncharacterized protein LOC119083416 [Bradysia coprophila]|uniref:uncharacterized protein LOC119083416 n=1 Tax=Bradysia coprophila TaxID=38358 RepID=UPI00187DA681|nr:uncharacterized protein LOC119083416 [Bradysia coprophila]
MRQKEAMELLSDAKRKLLIEEKRIENRKRVRKCREAKKDGKSSEYIAGSHKSDDNQRIQFDNSYNFPHSYRTKSAITKAYSKTNKSLPLSPTKRKLMVAKLHSFKDNKDRQDLFGCTVSTGKKSAHGLDATLVDLIERFYQRDDVSRISPNVKDAKYFRNPVTGQKELKQLRHLIFKLSDAYTKFVKEYHREHKSDPSVKISKFCDLRPQHVLLMGETPRTSCLCIYHANFSQCCTALNKYIPELPKNYTEMIKLLVCENDTKDCHFKKCKKCSHNVIERKLKHISNYSTNKTMPVKYMQWLKDKTANRFENQEQTGTIQQLVNHLLDIYVQFLKHAFIMHEQAENFNSDTKLVDSSDHFDEALLQIDFAENHKCESQDEIQQANYNQKQVSLFTSALRHRKITVPKVIASDNLHHTKETIVAYLYKLFSSFPSTIKTIRIWSDGPTSQFKSRYIASVILRFEELFKIKIYWNFFATAHGKACIDGIGASVKKQVQDKVLSRQNTVFDTNDFVNAFNSSKSKVNLFGMTPEEIEKINIELKLNDLFVNAPAISGISSYHQLQAVNGRIKGFVSSNDGYQN